MKISTLIVVKVVNAVTLEQISEAQGPSGGFIVPRVGEFIETTTHAGSDPKLFEITAVGHKYDEVHRNTTTLFVKPTEVKKGRVGHA